MLVVLAAQQTNIIAILIMQVGPPAAAGAANGSSQAATDPDKLQPVYRHFLSTVVVPEFKRLSRCLPDIISQVAALWPRYLAGAQQQQQQLPEDQVSETTRSLGGKQFTASGRHQLCNSQQGTASR